MKREPEKKREWIKIINEAIGEKVPEEVCCVCGHKLSSHIEEEAIWRCHSLSSDFYQCECVLRKNRAEGGIVYYDLKRRIEQQLDEIGKKEREASVKS